METKNKIPFNDWSKERIAEGRKICTSRHKKYLHDDRVTYITPKLPLWFIKKYLWRDEGAYHELELEKVMFDIYGRHIPNDEMFYVHFGEFK